MHYKIISRDFPFTNFQRFFFIFVGYLWDTNIFVEYLWILKTKKKHKNLCTKSKRICEVIVNLTRRWKKRDAPRHIAAMERNNSISVILPGSVVSFNVKIYGI